MIPLIVALVMGLALGFLGSMPIAGPIATLVFDRTLAGQEGEARAIGMGSALAESLYAFLAFYGFTRVVTAYPHLLPGAHVLGGIIFVLLGLYLTFRKGQSADTSTPKQKRQGWLLGLSIAALNPTLLVTWTSVIATLHSTDVLAPNPLDALPFALGVGAGSAAWFRLCVRLLSKYRKRFSARVIDRIMRIVGVLFVAGGAVTCIRLFLHLSGHTGR